MSNKVYRVKLYRKNTGPFECLVIASSQKRAKARAQFRAALAAMHAEHQLQHELISRQLGGKAAVAMLFGKAIKPKLRGENKVVRLEIVCLGRAK